MAGETDTSVRRMLEKLDQDPSALAAPQSSTMDVLREALNVFDIKLRREQGALRTVLSREAQAILKDLDK